MSRYDLDAAPPMRLGENEPIRLSMKTLVLIIGGVFAVGGMVVRWELTLQDHTKQLSTMQVSVGALIDKVGSVEKAQLNNTSLLKYIARDRQGPLPEAAK